MQSNTHESFDREPVAEGSSDRSFGLVFTAFFALVGLWPLVHKRPMRLWALYVSAAFFLIALAIPSILRPLNLLWARFGRLLSKVTNPIITGIMFYVIFTPAAVVLRLLGKDLLRLKYDRNATTYWIPRDPAGLVPESMRNQF
jgi:hypothetical protein